MHGLHVFIHYVVHFLDNKRVTFDAESTWY